jgi:hypothetical protein
MIELDAIELVLENAHGVALGLHLFIVATHVLHDLVDHELRISPDVERLMPVSMAIRRPQRRTSYSAMLFDTEKCRRTAYLMCSPRGEMKSRPTPAPVVITDLSKLRV